MSTASPTEPKRSAVPAPLSDQVRLSLYCLQDHVTQFSLGYTAKFPLPSIQLSDTSLIANGWTRYWAGVEPLLLERVSSNLAEITLPSKKFWILLKRIMGRVSE